MIIDDFAVSDQLWVRLLASLLTGLARVLPVYKGYGFVFVFNPCNHGDVSVLSWCFGSCCQLRITQLLVVVILFACSSHIATMGDGMSSVMSKCIFYYILTAIVVALSFYPMVTSRLWYGINCLVQPLL